MKKEPTQAEVNAANKATLDFLMGCACLCLNVCLVGIMVAAAFRAQ